MEIYGVGSVVYFGADRAREATVLGFTVEGAGVTYRVSWWGENGQREVELLESCEVFEHPDTSVWTVRK